MKRLGLLAFGIALVFVLAACGATPASVSPSVVPSAIATQAPSPIETPAPAVMVAQNATLGNILVGRIGMTLYTYANDTPNTSNCTGGCASAWPPLTAPAGTTPSAGPGVTGTLGVIQRADGTSQVTIDGKPLYYYAPDAKPGDATGQGVSGVWYVVQVAATP